MDYTENLNTILRLSRQEAERLNNPLVQPEHLLLGILRHQQGMAYQLLIQSGVKPAAVKEAIDTRFILPASANQDTPYSRTTARILRLTTIEAEQYGAETAGSVHLLLAVLRERVSFASMHLEEQYQVAYESIERLYPHPASPGGEEEMDEEVEMLDPEDMLGQLAGSLMPPMPKKQAKSKNGTPMLDKYGRDLTALAKAGNLDPVIGRENEIQRIVQILNRRKKNNPILIGDAGVGKSAIVEGLAQQIEGRRIVALEMAALVAGTSYRGQFEQRMKDVVSELRHHPEIILFIDEIHTLVGAGNAQGSLDAANILKPALARGEVQCIGATTTAEYRNTIEKDGALERRFQKVTVAAPDAHATLAILQRLSEQYGSFHKVEYTPESLKACVTLTDRYIADRSQPDKAIDALDEAGALGQSPVTEDHIRAIVSRMSGVPIQRIARRENEQLQRMDSELRRHVVGQDAAISRLVRAIRRSRMGLHNPQRPIGTFFFLGATGVGKTYLAQCLAEEMFGSRDAIIRFDMSEYAEKHTVSLLVGAPPGYLAHEDGGRLTEAVRRRPYSILLFDEIEKAHPDIFNVLLQLLDEGRLTDRQGRRVDFRNTIIILTSNVGTRQLSEFGAGVGFNAGELTQAKTEKTLHKALERTFPPEFINRIDDIITFSPLSRETLATIIRLELDRLRSRLAAQGHTLVISAKAKEQLLDLAYDPKNGARPVKRAIQTYIEDLICSRLMQNPDLKSIRIDRLRPESN
ncbi:MAG: ATP-dependent Clp protease ATP-binding subunit [Paludibacteraceae bacterium]|nr:ATP-dependent Clp protease ATP-binding subunit [Paludibacteraceae bacterium]